MLETIQLILNCTPDHLQLQAPEVTRSDLEVYLEKLKKTRASLQVTYDDFAMGLGEDPHQIKKDPRFVGFSPEVKLDLFIADTEKKLFAAENDAEKLHKLREQFIKVDTRVNDFSNSLNAYIFELDNARSEIKLMTNVNSEIKNDLTNLLVVHEDLKNQFVLLEKKFIDRNKKDLELIRAFIDNNDKLIQSMQTAIDACPLPIPYVSLESIQKSFDTIQNNFKIVYGNVEKIKKDMITQETLLQNAERTRQQRIAGNRYGFSALPSVRADEDKKEAVVHRTAFRR